MNKKKSVSYAKWGYIFILPFFISFFIFSLIPLADTVRFSFYEYYTSSLKVVGPHWKGLENYKSLLESDMIEYAGNTLLLWILGFIPQIGIALLLASWFADIRMKIRGAQVFKVIIYLPNIIMASAFAMLFFTLFSSSGPVNSILLQLGIIDESIDFMSTPFGVRSMICFMNFIMWFGNSTIMLMAAIMGISPDIVEAAELDGCSGFKRFIYVTLPMIRPILTYTLIVSLIGGLQMFDVPQILTNGKGTPDRTAMTLIMFLNNHLRAKNYGMAGALSVYLFIVSGILCFIVYRLTNGNDGDEARAEEKARRRRERRLKGVR